MTARIDVTDVVHCSKMSGTKFYINFLYILSKVLNSREDYRMGYLWQTDDLICYDVINPTQYVFLFKDLGLDDQTHYWFISGDQTSTIEWEVILGEEVQEEALKQSVSDAMRIHTHFHSHPVIAGGRVKVSVDYEGQIPVFIDDGRTRQLGTDETNGYLFYVAFHGDKLSLRLFHGLADGRGSFSFLKTMLLFGRFVADDHRKCNSQELWCRG